ncbi:MAG: hypothetical protein DHS20C13_02050 [Thermodesulfobacteriota bacterium]|nr:MAG: hypothetical protein DHS20C13_02050 [Thermodesulfobacteriota bacterium]
MPLKDPMHPDEITADWITHALKESGYLKHFSIKSIDKKILGEGKGLLSSVVRVGIEYDEQEENAPSSVVVKIEPEEGDFVDYNNEFSSFQREIKFYREVAANVPIRLPKFYYAVDDPPAYSLVLEDLSHFSSGDQVVGMHKGQVVSVVEQLARLQSAYWNNEALSELSWMPRMNGVSLNFAENWPSFVENYGPFLDSKAIKLGEKLSNFIDWKNNEIEKRPHTIVHADLREDNLMFGPPGSEDATIILDWQLTIRNIGAADVARLIGGSEIPKERKGHQFEILKKWHDTLIEHGVANYSWDDAVYDFRLGTLSYLCYPVHFHKSGISAQGRLKELIEVIYRRSFSCAVDIDAGSVLPD